MNGRWSWNNKQIRNAGMANMIWMSSIVRMMLEGEQLYSLIKRTGRNNNHIHRPSCFF